MLKNNKINISQQFKITMSNQFNYIINKGKANRQKSSFLEKIVRTAASFISSIPLYVNSPLLHNQPTRDYDSKALVNEVPQKDLPSGVLGFYSQTSEEITSVKDASTDTQSYVKSHESYHALWGSSEQQADAYAMSRTGHYKRTLLDPFYLGYKI